MAYSSCDIYILCTYGGCMDIRIGLFINSIDYVLLIYIV